MNTTWGVILFIISSIAYFGQAISAFWPETAARLGLAEAEADVDPTFYADGRGEAIWDTAVLWTLPLASLLLLLNNPAWVYFGLIGGGMYLYFAGRGIVVRKIMQRRGIRIGSPQSLKMATIFLALWGLAAIITIVMAIALSDRIDRGTRWLYSKTSKLAITMKSSSKGISMRVGLAGSRI